MFKEVFSEMYTFVSSNHILMVFFIAVVSGIFIMLMNSQKKTEYVKVLDREIKPGMSLILYGGFAALALLFLPAAVLFRKFQTVFFSYKNLWVMIPVIPVIAFMITCLITHAKQLKRPVRIITFVLSLFLLLCCGNMGVISQEGRELPQYKEEDITFGDSIPVLEKMKEISLSAKEAGTESPVFLAVPAITEYARQYSGYIKVLFGRDIWDGSLAAYNYNSYSEEMKSLNTWMTYFDAYGTLYYADNQVTDTFDYSNLDYASMDANEALHGGLPFAVLAKELGADAIVFSVNEKTDRAGLQYLENALSAHSEYVEVDSPADEGFVILFL